MNFNNSKKGKHKNPIKSLFEIEHFLQSLTQIKNSFNLVKDSKKLCNKKGNKS